MVCGKAFIMGMISASSYAISIPAGVAAWTERPQREKLGDGWQISARTLPYVADKKSIVPKRTLVYFSVAKPSTSST